MSDKKNPHAVALGRIGGSHSGGARPGAGRKSTPRIEVQFDISESSTKLIQYKVVGSPSDKPLLVEIIGDGWLQRFAQQCYDRGRSDEKSLTAVAGYYRVSESGQLVARTQPCEICESNPCHCEGL